MVGSLLGDGQVSEALGEFVQSRGEGNPFYIEEVVNSLIETESVVPDEGGWRLARSSGLSQTPPTIQELITARLDRLDPDAKLVVQEASVIGRTFLEPVLRAITASSVPLERSLDTLERLDLIRTKSRTPCREYVFKHALIQDAVYGGLLHRQRRELHDRVGAAVESFSQDRAADFVETLAFHYKQGLSEAKAVEYLVASGDRALKRFALEESHRYYKEAFELISASGARTEEDKNRLFDLLVAWALVYYYRAQFKEMTTLLGAHRTLAETLQDASRKGMFFAWLGFSCFWQGENLRDSYEYLHRAIALGEAAGNDRVIGHACAFLTLTCAEMGLLGECDVLIRRARVIAARHPGETLMALNYLAAMGYLGWFSGNKQLPRESATHLLDHGRETSNVRHQMVGSIIMGMFHFMNFDLESAMRLVDDVVRSSQDPFYADYARLLLGMFHLVKQEYGAAEALLRRTIEFNDRAGTKYLKANAYAFLGAALAATGHLEQGVRMIESSRDELRSSGRRVFQGMSELLLGDIYRQMATHTAPVKLITVLANFRFLARNYFLAARRAEEHLRAAIELLVEAGASGFLGPVFHRLGLLYAAQGRDAEAEVALKEAVRLLEACDATAALREAELAMAALRGRRGGEPLCA
jgi:tetratricopeptide (TPR) repeat protein